ncbi:MAG TPA: HAMP domain-containing protein, partial [Micromonosporaceae bacterium]
MRWWRRLSLRARLTLLSAAGLAVGLALGGLLIVNVLHYVLIRSVDSSTHQTASDVVAQAADATLPAPIAVAGSSIVQVVDPDGSVIDYTDGTDHLVPMLNRAQLREALSGKVLTIPGYAAGTYDGDLRVIARRVTVHSDNARNGEVQTVIVAGPTHAVEESIETVTRALLIAYPLLVALLSALAWLVVGWTLRPVEALRRSAEGISAGRGSVGPLPVPDGDDEIHRLAVTLNGMLDRLEAGRARQRA